jgi:hypothetical protein
MGDLRSPKTLVSKISFFYDLKYYYNITKLYLLVLSSSVHGASGSLIDFLQTGLPFLAAALIAVAVATRPGML